MKYLLLLLFTVGSAFSHAITIEEVNQKTSAFIDVWIEPITVGNVDVYPQKGLFDMESFIYKRPTLKDKQSGKYDIWDGAESSVKPVNNMLRIKSGKAPVSLHDNEFVRLCRLDNTASAYYEMSALQANFLSDVTEGKFDPSESCLLGGGTKDYWLARYNTFYDKYGNKRGVR